MTTERLIGKATVAPTAFRNRLRRGRRGDFEVWDAPTLAEIAESSPRFPVGPSPALLPAVGAIESGIPSERALEGLLAPLALPTSGSVAEVRRAFVDNALVAERLAEKVWPFLALAAALNGVRIGAVRAHGSSAQGRELMRNGLDYYVELGQRVLAPLLASPSTPRVWTAWIAGGTPRMVSYAVTCVKALEYLGLAALHREHTGDLVEARRFAGLCACVADGQPGAAHPISDRFAASLPPAIAGLVRFGHQESATRLLRRTTKWLCDRYEGVQFGLADAYSTPDHEVRMLLGGPFASVQLEKRTDSTLAVALADAAHAFLPEEYPLVVNDFVAVRLTASAIHAKDEPGAYFMNRGGTQGLINIAYPPEWAASPLRHHTLQSSPRVPESVQGPVVPLALAAVLRDRLFSDVLERLRPNPA